MKATSPKLYARPCHNGARGRGRGSDTEEVQVQQEAEGSKAKVSRSPILEPSAATSNEAKQELPWLVWQLADSAFPTGGFAHSNGLEAAWQQGEIRSTEDLASFIRVQLAQIGRVALPFVNDAYHRSQAFHELDRLCDVFVSNHVANRGSRAQGQAFLLASAQSFDRHSVVSFRASVLNEKLPGHLAPVFGSVLRLLDVNHPMCVRLFLFMNLRSLLAGAVRLGIVGPMAAQLLQSRLEPHAEEIARLGLDSHVADAAQISPLLDILHGAHDRLYSRLFQT